MFNQVFLKKKSTSPGVDHISYGFDESTTQMPSSFTPFYEFSMGVLSISWKQAISVPILKPGKDPTSSFYRPIAMTSCLCKIMKSMINSRLMWYFEKITCYCLLKIVFVDIMIC